MRESSICFRIRYTQKIKMHSKWNMYPARFLFFSSLFFRKKRLFTAVTFIFWSLLCGGQSGVFSTLFEKSCGERERNEFSNRSKMVTKQRWEASINLNIMIFTVIFFKTLIFCSFKILRVMHPWSLERVKSSNSLILSLCKLSHQFFL